MPANETSGKPLPVVLYPGAGGTPNDLKYCAIALFCCGKAGEREEKPPLEVAWAPRAELNTTSGSLLSGPMVAPTAVTYGEVAGKLVS